MSDKDRLWLALALVVHGEEAFYDDTDGRNWCVRVAGRAYLISYEQLDALVAQQLVALEGDEVKATTAGERKAKAWMRRKGISIKGVA